MNAEEMTQSKDLSGECKINGNTLTILYDSGATHSFISHNCVAKLGLLTSELPYYLLISTPTSKLVRTS